MVSPAFRLLLILSALFLLAACGSRPNDELWAEVNGQPIFAAQVEKYYERQVANLPEPLTPPEELARKLSILDELIQNEILWQKAGRAGVQATDTEVEERLGQLRAATEGNDYERQLRARGSSLAELKSELRRDIAIRKLLERAVGAAAEVSEQEVSAHYEQYKNHFRSVETQFHVAHILVTPGRQPDVHNLRNHDATNEVEARQKCSFLLERLRVGDEFSELARNYSEDPATALAGGDLGFFPESALSQSDPGLRSAVQRLEVGQVAGPIRTAVGYQLVKLLEREPPGQRELTDATVQRIIREQLRGQKRDLLEAAYIEQARSQARVVNYLARQILESHRVSP